LLCYGAVRPYKGVDLALDALARVDPGLRIKLVVAGRFWAGKRELELQVQRLGLGDRVELRDRYVTNDETALLFAASDAVLLPYRSASQSGVAAMAFSYRKPIVATAVGGLPAVVRDGENGFLCPPGDAAALARAIESLPSASERLREGVARGQQQYSFDRYARLIIEAVGRLA
jgi:glycosyltransferase involved in cell wall biosynthesis